MTANLAKEEWYCEGMMKIHIIGGPGSGNSFLYDGTCYKLVDGEWKECKLDLFKATQWSGDLISSEEGQMEWIKYSDLSAVKTVDDFDDLLKVMNTPELTEFQYLVSGDEWTVSIR